MRPELTFDFRNPDYGPIFQARIERLAAIRADPCLLAALRVHYRDNPADFISDWGITYDPRNIERGLPATIPFILFPKQREWVDWVMARWRNQEPGIVEKTRDMGMSWLSVAFACTMCLFNEGLTFGFGSRKEEYVDKLGHPKSLFYKARLFLEHLPPEFLGGWTRECAPHMRISFPGTNSVLTGEAGDNIGRGDRASIYFVDEAQPLTSRILTPNGWKLIGEIRKGDLVTHPSGRSVAVKGVSQRYKTPVYEFGFSDGTFAQSSPNHLWTVDKVWGSKEKITLRAKDIAEKYRYDSPGGQTQYLYRLPTCSPVSFEPKGDLPIHPYLLGALLGDGCLTKSSVEIASADPEIIDRISGLVPDGYRVNFAGKISYRIVHSQGRGVKRTVRQTYLNHHLTEMGLRGKNAWEKHIPESYLFSSPSDRLELLRGLMDTDGSASGGRATFHSSSKELADGVEFLARSLGGVVTQKVKPDHRGYRDQHYVYLSLPEGVIPFHLKRKADKMRSVRKHQFAKTIVSVRVLPEQEVQCIQVDAEDGLYVTDDFAVTHNCAFLERPQLVEASLSATTNCRIDISTPNGTNNPFAQKRFKFPSERVFTFHWRSHPARDDAWYAKQCEELDAVTVAQEIDINYAASVEGVVIPPEWVKAAIDADKKLGITVTGRKRAALDVADEGTDECALALGTGIRVDQVPSWSGKGSDIMGTVAKAFMLCDEYGADQMRFDADGLGAGVRGDARVLNEKREENRIIVEAWRGSAAVVKPDSAIPSANPAGRKDRTNKDYFKNSKAQGAWELRVRFQRTYRAVTEPDYQYDPSDLIVLNGSMPNLAKLEIELSQPTWSLNNEGKVIIDKAPDGMRSPNLYDAVMILMAPRQGSGYSHLTALS